MQGQFKKVAEKWNLSHVAPTYMNGTKTEPVGRHKFKPSSKGKNADIDNRDMKIDGNGPRGIQACVE